MNNYFFRFGSISSFLVPKSKSVALIDFVEPSEARQAFKGLAYRKYKHFPLYLEWAPLGIIDKSKATAKKVIKDKTSSSSTTDKSNNEDKSNVKNTKKFDDDDGQDFASIFIKNLNFITTEVTLEQHLTRILGRSGGLRTVSIPTKMKGSALLSMGYGFAEFKSHSLAEAALKKLNGSICEEHKLEVKPSDKRLSVAPIKKSNEKNSENKSSKLIIRNVAFQATVAELKSLFSTFGSVKRVRIPKKMGGDHRGFAFIDFSTHAEAVSAMTSLKQAHLYGRHLIIEWAKDEDEDLDVLRKRASINDKAIKSDHKKKKLDDTGGDGYGGGSDGFGGLSGFRDGDDE
jgi:multiple RNA-binding domain-containing protein 1